MKTFLRRVTGNPGTCWAALLVLLSCLYPAMGVLKHQGLAYYTKADVVYFLLLPRGDVINLLLPIIAVFPAAGLCAEDFSTGYITFILQRCGRRWYVFQRLSQAVLGAVLAVTIGFALYFAVVYTLSPYTQSIDNLEMFKAYQPFVLNAFALPLALDTLFRIAFAASAWALIGVGFAAFQNEFHALLATTLVYYFLSQLLVGSALNEWMPRRVQMPDVFTWVPLWRYTVRQAVYFVGALLFGGASLVFVLHKGSALRS